MLSPNVICRLHAKLSHLLDVPLEAYRVVAARVYFRRRPEVVEAVVPRWVRDGMIGEALGAIRGADGIAVEDARGRGAEVRLRQVVEHGAPDGR